MRIAIIPEVFRPAVDGVMTRLRRRAVGRRRRRAVATLAGMPTGPDLAAAASQPVKLGPGLLEVRVAALPVVAADSGAASPPRGTADAWAARAGAPPEGGPEARSRR